MNQVEEKSLDERRAFTASRGTGAANKNARWFHYIEFAAFRVTVALVSRLPESVAYWMFARTADLYRWFSPRRRRIGRENIRLAFPDADDAFVERTLRESVRNAFQTVLDAMVMLRHIDDGTFKDRVDISSMNSMQMDGAWFGLTGHVGSWEVSGVTIATLVDQAHAIGRMPKNPMLSALLRKKREHAGLILHERRGGIRPLHRALQDGYVALQVIDQNQRLRPVFVPFFGKLAATDRSAAAFVRRHGYPLHFGAAIRTGVGFHFIFESQALEFPESVGDRDLDVLSGVTAINQTVEAFARRHPSQYLWIHNRYRTRPPSDSDECPASPAS